MIDERLDEIETAHDQLEASPIRLRVLDDHPLVKIEHAAIPGLVEITRAALTRSRDNGRCVICGGWAGLRTGSDINHIEPCPLDRFLRAAR